MEKLTVLNDALLATGNNRLNVLNDGTDEWLVANQAFDRAVRDLASRHNWPFGKATADLVPADTDDNPSKVHSVAYLLPTDVFHLVRVLVSVDGDSNDPAQLEDYEMIGRYLCSDYDSGLSIEYMTTPADAAWHPQAAEILTTYVEAGCFRGLNEDFVEADKALVRAESRLIEARPRVDRQNPVQNAYNTSIKAARRSRMGGV